MDIQLFASEFIKIIDDKINFWQCGSLFGNGKSASKQNRMLG